MVLNLKDIECDFAASVHGNVHTGVASHESDEYDEYWISCNCGAAWSVVECESPTGEDYLDFELVSDGDEEYHLPEEFI